MKISKYDLRLADALKEEAAKWLKDAEKEAQNGEMLQYLVTQSRENNDESQARRYALIAIWHYERALNKYRTATANLKDVHSICLSEKKLSKETRYPIKQIKRVKTALLDLRAFV